MTFELQIAFEGLCLFVPEPPDLNTNGVGLMHVLMANACDPGMPCTDDGANGSMAKHYPRLIFPRNCLPDPDHPPPGVDLIDVDTAFTALAGSVDLTGHLPQTAPSPLPTDIPNVSVIAARFATAGVAGSRVKRAYITDPPTGYPVACHITLDGSVGLSANGSQPAQIVAGLNSAAGMAPVSVCASVTCSIPGVAGNTLTLKGVASDLTLKSPGDVLLLEIANLPLWCYSGSGVAVPNPEPSHFSAFYHLLDTPNNVSNWPVPKSLLSMDNMNDRLVPQTPAPTTGEVRSWGILPITCSPGGGCQQDQC